MRVFYYVVKLIEDKYLIKESFSYLEDAREAMSDLEMYFNETDLAILIQEKE